LHFLHDHGGRAMPNPCHARRLPAVSALLGLVMSLAAPAVAQIELGISLEHRAYMAGEAFTARVVVQNGLDIPLVFDDEYSNAELFVEMVRDKSAGAPESDRRTISRQTVIMPGNKTLELVEITSLFNLTRTGGHRLRAGVRYEGYLYLSQPVGFDLVQGIEMLSVRRGLSGYHEVMLEYSLRYWKRTGGEQAFFVIKDVNSGIVYGTFRLGPVVRVNPPAIRFDSQGRAVVVHQSGRNRFTRSVVEVDSGGAVLVAQTHHLEDGRQYPGSGVPLRDDRQSEQKRQE